MPDTGMPSSHRKGGIFFHADFDLGQLLKLAEQLRGQTCTCDESQLPKSGAFNFVIFLEFGDGVQWVFRAPSSRYAAALQGDAAGSLLASEAATLKYIREHTSIPVPEVFHYCASHENDIGIPYILMSKAGGHPLGTFDWRTHTHELPKVKGFSTPERVLSTEEKGKIMRQLGRYARQLFRLRFPSIGSLCEGDEGYYIGECLSPGHVLSSRETIENLPRGPFSSEEDYYLSLATALRRHAEELPMGHHVLRAPIPVPQEYPTYAKYYTATDRWNDFATLEGIVESSVNRLQYCLASDVLRDSIIPHMIRPTDQLTPGFPLCHHDISVQNLFVDEDLNITCVIDWAFSSTVPPAQLLATPGLPHPRDLVLDLPLVSSFRSGFEGDNQKGVIESDDWMVGQMVSRFTTLVKLDALQDYHHLEALWALTREPITPGDEEDDTNTLAATLATRSTTREALVLASELAADDEPESKIRKEEKEYFDVVGARRLAIARKVVLASKMNPRFVADARLWRWIDAVLEYYDGQEEST